ncbi:MAG: hypothetical protein MUF15_24925 [Acidobacteria bacterium]|nr:hypothetical protein [Acidobacteriota bacterium]
MPDSERIGLAPNLPAIDQILLNIESICKQKEFEALQSLFNRLMEREGKNLHPGGSPGWNGLLGY